MSTATAPDVDLDGVTYEHVRDVLNPFTYGWMPYFRVLTKWYMNREDRDWSPLGPHHDDWFDRFESGRDCITLAHRSSLKTTTVLGYVLGNLEYRNGFHAAWVGNNETLAYEKAHSEFNKLTDRNPWLTELQEKNRLTDQKGKKEFRNDSSLSVGWLFGGIEGRHVDLLIVDDLIKEKGDGDMQEIDDWLSSVIVPVQEHGGQTLVIGTRKTQTDIYSYLDTREGFEFTEYPAVLNVWDAEYGEDAPHRRPDPDLYTEREHPLDPNRSAQILWPERGTDYLRTARDKQSEHAWSREFCLVVRTREGAVYSMFDPREHVTDSYPDQDDVVRWLQTVDWGSGHPAGLLAIARTNRGYHIADEYKRPVGGTSEYDDLLSDLQSEYGIGRVWCDPEDKRGAMDLRKQGFDAQAADNDVDAGIRTVKDLFLSGKLQIHRRCSELIAELKAYRYNPDTGDPVKKNDHLVDSMRYGIFNDYQRGGAASGVHDAGPLLRG